MAGATDVHIGSGLPGTGNLLSGNTWGVQLLGNSTNVRIQGNRIGTDVTGTSAIPNPGGILVVGVGSRVGTNADGISDELERNIIAGNLYDGIAFGYGANNNVLAGNYIGLDVSGDPLGNGGGVELDNARDNLIGTNADGVRDEVERNVISANRSYGIWLPGTSTGAVTTGNVIAGNYIGTGIDGTSDLGNATNGIALTHYSRGAIIGGTSASARNVISGNDGNGVYIADSLDHQVLGNYIGLDSWGENALPNDQGGVQVYSYYYTGASGRLTSGNVIGGTSPGAGNVISGNDQYGIAILGEFATGNLVQGNLIGTDSDGPHSIGNLGPGVIITNANHNTVGGDDMSDGLADGILIENASGVLVGGTEPAARNVISGNCSNGILLSGGSDHVIPGNYIGVTADGTTAVPNGVGVYIAGSANNTIGRPDERNVIAYNSTGVVVVGATAAGNSIRGNSIHSNRALGIDLGADGVTFNDKFDEDLGPNQLQNFPELKAIRAGNTTLIVGTLASLPNATFTLDFYANDTLDPTGHGEGQRWLATIQVQTNSQGFAQFREELAAATAAGTLITATATDSSGSTSEFSGGFMATGKVGKKLIVGGGNGNDVVKLKQGSIIVEINGETFVFDDDGSTDFEVQLLAGDDTLISEIINDTQAFVGDGDDFMQLGSGNDQVSGGDGDDTVLGGNGNDVIDGGQGSDQVQVGADGTVRTDATDQLSGIAVSLTSPVSLDESTAVRGQPLVFASDIPSDGGTVTWQFGDGFVADGVTVTHAITDLGIYTLTTIITGPSGSRTTIARDLSIVAVAMQRDPNDSAKTALAVGGTMGNDQIRIYLKGHKGDVQVKLKFAKLYHYQV